MGVGSAGTGRVVIGPAAVVYLHKGTWRLCRKVLEEEKDGRGQRCVQELCNLCVNGRELCKEGQASSWVGPEGPTERVGRAGLVAEGADHPTPPKPYSAIGGAWWVRKGSKARE